MLKKKIKYNFQDIPNPICNFGEDLLNSGKHIDSNNLYLNNAQLTETLLYGKKNLIK